MRRHANPKNLPHLGISIRIPPVVPFVTTLVRSDKCRSIRGDDLGARLALALVLEQDLALAAEQGLDAAAEESERRRQRQLEPHGALADIDLGRDFLAHRLDAEAQPVARPGAAHVGAARYLARQLVGVGGDAAPRFLLAEAVRDVDDDRSVHALALAARAARGQTALWRLGYSLVIFLQCSAEFAS